MEEVQNKVKQLFEAKKAVLKCLENENIRVNLQGLAYWAQEVERLRDEIKKAL